MKYLREQLYKFSFFRYIRLWILNNFILLPNLKKQLKNPSKKKKFQNNSPVIFVPLLETNHYQYYQLLILCKSLELRGCKIKLLLCDSFLPGCEIKNVVNDNKNPCLECNFNRKNQNFISFDY